jgi:hypothetical protein
MSQEIVFAGYAQYKQRLAPAVLSEGAQSGKINSNILGAWLVAQGIDVNSLGTAEEVAVALYKATQENYTKLVWDVKPKALLRLEEEERGLRKRPDIRKDREAWAQKVKDSEAAKANAKNQASLKKQLDQYIENICFVDGLRGFVDHGKTEKVKAACTKYVEGEIKAGRDLTPAFAAVTGFVQKEHAKDEAARERM